MALSVLTNPLLYMFFAAIVVVTMLVFRSEAKARRLKGREAWNYTLKLGVIVIGLILVVFAVILGMSLLLEVANQANFVRQE